MSVKQIQFVDYRNSLLDAVWEVSKPGDFRVLKFRFCESLICFSDDYVATKFRRARPFFGLPQQTQEYISRARSLGYATAAEMNREHDPLHCLLAEWCDLYISPTLFAVAHKLRRPSDADEEEARVLDFQSLMNGGHYQNSLAVLEPLGLDALVKEARRLLRPFSS